MIKLIVAVLVLLVAVGAAMIWSQEDIIFPTRAVPAAGPLLAGAERLTLSTPGGETLHGVHIPPASATAGQRILVIGFGGNAWNGQHVAEYLHELYPGADVVAFHYRGYRPSTGSPSAEALLADAPLVYDAAVERIRPDRTIAVGFSIGSAVAASLVKRRPVDGIVLVTPFDSMKAMARDLYPWLPVGMFLNHDLDTVELLAGSPVPTAIVAAERDEIVAPQRTEALRKQIANLVFDRTIPAAGHNDLYARSEFQQAMDEALETVLLK